MTDVAIDAVIESTIVAINAPMGNYEAMLKTLLRWTGNHARCCVSFSRWRIRLKGMELLLVGCPRHGGVICDEDAVGLEPLAYFTRDGYIMRAGECIGSGNDLAVLERLNRKGTG